MSAAKTETPHTAVSRIVFPELDVAEVAALYTDTGDGAGSQPGEDYEILGRHSIRIFSRHRVSLGTYFNAFPASYWQRFTAVRSVRLRARLSGTGLISVYRSSARGRSSAVASHTFHDESVVFDLPMTSFIDGGYYWLEIASGETDVELVEAAWEVPTPEGHRAGQATIGITTFNRVPYCVSQLLAIGGEAELKSVVRRVVVVDQGTDAVEDDPRFGSASDMLGDRLHVVHQPNLGGSGGFSRAMLEGVQDSGSDYVLLLDDDAISEPEAVARAVQFADFAAVPTIVGGGMLHLDDRAVLYTRGEVWDDNLVWMKPSGGSDYDVDFAENTLRETPDLHRRVHADFNGWWMCLIPTKVIREIGLSIPVFLKFDDIEYSLRASEHGYPTVCLPGVAVWHMAWHDKDPTRTWEEYFIHRNRYITGLLHSSAFRGGLLPLVSFLGDVKLLFMLQYSTVRLRHEALRDILKGPSAVQKMLPVRQAEIRAVRSQYSDAVVVHDLDKLPAVRRSSLRQTRRPTNPVATAETLTRTLVRQFLTRESEESARRPDKVIAAQDIRWWRFADIDSALVTSPDGMGVSWYKRSRRELFKALRRSIALHVRVTSRWGRLSSTYRSGLDDFVSERAWSDLFGVKKN